MTLYEMSFVYQQDADRFRERIHLLREAEEKTHSFEARQQLRRRIDDLTKLMKQSHELAVLTENYYGIRKKGGKNSRG